MSEGLSKFYGQKEEVNLNNLPLFEGDIKALFFDFKQPLFLAVCSNGAISTDESNSMEEFIFQLKQRGVKNIKRVKQLWKWIVCFKNGSKSINNLTNW